MGGWGCDGHSHCWVLAPNVGQVSRELSILGWLWEFCGCVAEVLCRVKAKAASQVVLYHWQLLLLLPGSFLCICVASKREAKSLWDGPMSVLWDRGTPAPGSLRTAGEEGMSTWSPLIAQIRNIGAVALGSGSNVPAVPGRWIRAGWDKPFLPCPGSASQGSGCTLGPGGEVGCDMAAITISQCPHWAHVPSVFPTIATGARGPFLCVGHVAARGQFWSLPWPLGLGLGPSPVDIGAIKGNPLLTLLLLSSLIQEMN